MIDDPPPSNQRRPDPRPPACPTFARPWLLASALIGGPALADPPGAPGPPTPQTAPPIYAPAGTPGPKGLGFDFRRKGHVGVGLAASTSLTGLSLKAMLTGRDGLEVTFGIAAAPYAWWPHRGAGLAFDYVHHPPELWSADAVALAWDIGMGADIRLATDAGRVDVGLGIHAVASLELLLRRLPIDVALQYRPGVVITPRQGGGLAFAWGDVALAARWWF